MDSVWTQYGLSMDPAWWFDVIRKPLVLDYDELEENVGVRHILLIQYIRNNMDKFVIKSREDDIRSLLEAVINETWVD
jgi:hypothetical protein